MEIKTIEDYLAVTFALAFLVALLGIGIYVNIWNYRRRSKMTPEERARDSEDHRRIPGDW